MAVWEVRVVFGYGDRSWENVWHIDAGSADDVPAAVITALHDFHIGKLLSIYELLKIVRRPAGSHDEFIEAIYNEAGGIATGTADAMPLFNTLKFFLTGGAGRPGFKFLRGLLRTVDVLDSDSNIEPSLVADVEVDVLALIAAVAGADAEIVYGLGKIATSASTQLKVQMRQLHRKRKRSTS
jgi:hypothetical protein